MLPCLCSVVCTAPSLCAGPSRAPHTLSHASPYHVPCPPSPGDELKEKQAAAREASKEAREVARENQAVLRQVAAAEASIAEAERDVQQVRGEGSAVMCCDEASTWPGVCRVCSSCVPYSWQHECLQVNVRGQEGLCIIAHKPCWANNPAMSGCQDCLACGADSRPHKHVVAAPMGNYQHACSTVPADSIRAPLGPHDDRHAHLRWTPAHVATPAAT